MVIAAVFLIGAVYANKLGFRAIARTNLIISFIAVIGVLTYILGISRFFNINRIFPVLGNGLKETISVGPTNLYAFFGISYLFFLKPHLNKKEKYNKIAYGGTVISVIYLTLFIISFVLALPVKTIVDNSFSVYFISRMIGFGNILQRIEALYVFNWILIVLSFVSISIFFVIDIFSELTNIKDSKVTRLSFGAIIFGLALIPKNVLHITIIEEWFHTIFTLLIFVFSFLILLFAYIKQKKSGKEVNKIEKAN